MSLHPGWLESSLCPSFLHEDRKDSDQTELMPTLVGVFYVFVLSCVAILCARLFICALWSPAGKGLTAWLSFVVSYCEFVTFPLVSWVRCGTWLYRFLIFAPLLTFVVHSHIVGFLMSLCVCELHVPITLSRPPYPPSGSTYDTEHPQYVSFWLNPKLYVTVSMEFFILYFWGLNKCISQYTCSYNELFIFQVKVISLVWKIYTYEASKLKVQTFKSYGQKTKQYFWA